jgi:hypothetical protein
MEVEAGSTPQATAAVMAVAEMVEEETKSN